MELASRRILSSARASGSYPTHIIKSPHVKASQRDRLSKRLAMGAYGPDEPLLEFGIALAGVVAAAEAGRRAASSPEFATAIQHFRRLDMHMAWLADALPGLALPSLSLVVIQLTRIREIVARGGDERLGDVYDPQVELLLVARGIDVRVALTAEATRQELGLTVAELSARFSLQHDLTVALLEGRLRTGADLAAIIDGFASESGAEYMQAVGGSASAAMVELEHRRLQLQRFRPQA